jgi:transcriptional regulator with XRE-family HTH domain
MRSMSKFQRHTTQPGRMCLERLRDIREHAGYSQQQLADESGVSQHTISELELGRRRPQGRTLLKLARVLDVDVRDLAAPTLREWALTATEEEFDQWLEAAGLDQVLKLIAELSTVAQGETPKTDRHRYIMGRIDKVVSRLITIAGPFTLVETSRSRKEREAKATAREDQADREATA